MHREIVRERDGGATLREVAAVRDVSTTTFFNDHNSIRRIRNLSEFIGIGAGLLFVCSVRNGRSLLVPVRQASGLASPCDHIRYQIARTADQ